jgi:conjugative transfer pilus assembly protein TraH
MPTAGCGGISAHFGGFSFVSGAQIEQLIKNIGQNAVGMVVSVVIKTLCPICDAVIQAMTKLAQDAAKLAIDSCAVASTIVNQVSSSTNNFGLGSNEQYTTQVCGKSATIQGKNDDYLSAVQSIDGLCNSLSSAMKYAGAAIGRASGTNPDGTPKPASAEDKKVKDDMERENAYGNTTWNALNAVFGDLKAEDMNTDLGRDDYRNRMMLMNVLGTEIITEENPDEPGTVKRPESRKNPMLSSKQVFELFMCGAPRAYNADGTVNSYLKTRNTEAYCKYFYGDPNSKAIGEMGQNGGYDWTVFECAPGNDPKGNPNYKSCITLREVALRDAQFLKGVGFLPQTEAILADAVEAVRTNRETGFSQQFLTLAASVNFPIYQAVNAAAVYPASTADLMSTMSVLVAESLVYAKLEQLVRPQGKNPNDIRIKREIAQRVYDVLENMGRQHLAQREAYGRMMAVQEGAVHSIRQVNLAIQKQVLTPELLGNHKYGSQVANTVSMPNN